jgi:flavin-dependent dehydrogenase
LFVGLKRRHRFASGADAAELEGFVDIYLFKGGYCGINPVEDGAVNVCLLVDERWLACLPSPKWDAVAAEISRLNPNLGRRLRALRPDDAPLAVARISLTAPGPVSGPLLRLGDAAGMIAPLCGDGQAMALDSAILLAELMAKVERTALPEAWAAAWRRRYSARLRLGRGLQRLLLQPHAAEGVLAACGLLPAVPRWLLALTRG